MKIFLLEDDTALQKGISLKLTMEGHTVSCAGDVLTAREKINERMDFAIIDINLPDGSGLDVCKALRDSQKDTHILLLTARDMETDIVMGYAYGADDYMIKPFSLSVLLSKIGAVQRRKTETTSTEQRTGSLRFDPERQTAMIREREISLTRNEGRLLAYFLKHRGQVLTKDQLLSALWDIDGDFVDDNTLAVNVRRLREKLEKDPSAPSLIENIRGVGYRLCGELES